MKNHEFVYFSHDQGGWFSILFSMLTSFDRYSIQDHIHIVMKSLTLVSMGIDLVLQIFSSFQKAVHASAFRLSLFSRSVAELSLHSARGSLLLDGADPSRFFNYFWIWSALLLARDCIDDFLGGVTVAFFHFLEGFHLLLYGIQFITWLIQADGLPSDYLFFACLFLHAASGSYLTPRHSTGYAFSNHLIGYFRNSLLKLIIPQWSW